MKLSCLLVQARLQMSILTVPYVSPSDWSREGYADVITNCVLLVRHEFFSDLVSTFQIVLDRDLAPDTVILFLYLKHKFHLSIPVLCVWLHITIHKHFRFFFKEFIFFKLSIL
jgi:hypothetical protein